jgi:hypothetical protein
VSFEGTWEDSKPTAGLYHLENGVDIEMNEEHNGTITWAERRAYKGDIGSDLNPSGAGKMIFPNGNVYEGDWKHGLMNGCGTYIWADGRKYEGTTCMT